MPSHCISGQLYASRLSRCYGWSWRAGKRSSTQCTTLYTNPVVLCVSVGVRNLDPYASPVWPITLSHVVLAVGSATVNSVRVAPLVGSIIWLAVALAADEA